MCVWRFTSLYNGRTKRSSSHPKRNIVQSKLYLNVVLPLGAVTSLLPLNWLFVLWSIFLWLLCSVFHTHMALSHPRGIDSSGLMWILVWVKCSSHLCINAYCIINVFVKSQFPICNGELTGISSCVLKTVLKGNISTSQSPENRGYPTVIADSIFMLEPFLMSSWLFPFLIKGYAVKIQGIQGCDEIKWDTVMTLLSERLIIQTQSWDRRLAEIMTML